MALVQAVLAGLVALIITPGLLFYFDVTPKVVVLLAGVALLICWPGLRPAKALTFLIVAALLSLALSTVFSANPALSLFGTNWRRYGAVVQAASLLFAWVVASHPERSGTLLRGISITAIAAGLYGIAQYFGWDPLLPAAQYHIGEGIWTIVRPPGSMGYVSYFATWLLMAAFLSFGLASKEQGPWRMMAWAGGAVALVAMSLTGTRAALLGLAAGIAVWLLGRGFRVTRRMTAAAVVIGVAVAGFYSLARGVADAQPGAVVFGGPLGRRASFALARQPAHGDRAAAAGSRTGSVHRGVSAVRIEGTGAGVPRFFARIAAQHVPGCAGGAGDYRVRDPAGALRGGPVVGLAGRQAVARRGDWRRGL